MVTSTILWFGGQRSVRLGDAPLIVGGGFDTVVIAVDELFELSGSGGAAAAIVAVFLRIAPFAVAHATLTTSVNVAVSPGAIVGFVHVTVPPLPTAGTVHVHPAAAVVDTNVVPAGSVSLMATPVAVLRAGSLPLFFAVSV